jgi:hypothetical protein
VWWCYTIFNREYLICHKILLYFLSSFHGHELRPIMTCLSLIIVVKVKVKMSLCFNWAPCHEGILGKWRYSSMHLDLGVRWRWVVSFMPWLLYPRERAPGTHWIGGWVGPRASLDVLIIVAIFLIFFLLTNSNLHYYLHICI